MRNLLIVFFVICLLFLCFIFPFKTRVMGHVNLLEMKCYYSVKSWILKLLCGKIEFDNGKLEMTNENTFLSGAFNDEFMKRFFGEMLQKLDVKKIEIFFTGGFKENSYASAIMCGTIVSIVESFYGYLSLKFDRVKLYKDISPTFNEDNLELTMDLVVSFSIFKIVKSLLGAGKKIEKLKEIENER